MRTMRAVRLILAVLTVVAVATPVSAQTQIGGFGVEGNVEAGWRFFIDQHERQARH